MLKKLKNLSKEERDGWFSILYSGFAVAVCFSVAVMAIFIGSKDMFAWFATNRDTDASGQSLHVRESYDLIIRSTSGGPDVSTTTTGNRLSFSAYPAGGVLRPGLAGAYNAYVVYGENKLNPTYNLSISCMCEPAQDGNAYRDGTTAVEQARAMELAQTHIAFFMRYENGVYSDWLEPGESFTVACTEASVAQEEQCVTIYWMWVRTYEELLPDAASSIAAEDRARMMTHIEANPAQWFLDYDPLNDTSFLRTYGYNGADTFLANILNEIWFRTDFAGS